MTEPKNDDLELDLDLKLDDEPAAAAPAPVPQAGAQEAVATPAPRTEDPAAAPEPPVAGGASVVAEPAPAAADAGLEGQWVWQFAAPPPPPSFSAVFFAGRAFPELYRFFGAGVLVAIGALLPWGPGAAWLAEVDAEAAAGYAGPQAGVATPMGALTLLIALWLAWAACYGIYSGRQKIVPVFLMLLPAWFTWSETAAAWGRMPSNWGAQLKLYEVFKGTGSGVFLALIGSSIVAVQLLLTIARLFRKDPKAAADGGRARKPKDDKSARSEAGASETKAGDASSGAKAEDAKGGRRGKKR